MVARGRCGAIGAWVKRHDRDLWLALCLALVAWSAYNLGYIRGRRPPPSGASTGAMFRARADAAPARPQGSVAPRADHRDPRVVASKSSSSKKFHFTWCPGASKIKEANRVWFPTETAAIAAGYTLAGNCAR